MELTAEQQEALRECTKGEPEFQKVLSLLKDMTPAKQGPVIMVIDDDPAISLLVKKVLEQRGYQPIVTQNPAVALGIMRYKTPDLILLDINMPDMDGSELFVKIRELPHMTQVPVVYMTGLISPDEEQDFNLGAAMQGVYLGKPFSADKLIKVITSIIKK